MPTIKTSKRVNAVDLYDEIVASNPSLAPIEMPNGRPLSQFVVEQGEDGDVFVHVLKDDVDPTVLANVDTAIKDHQRKPEKTNDKVAEARKRVKQKADQGDIMAQDIMTLLGQ